MNGGKKITSIFDNCRETASQESFLQTCGFGQRGVPPDSDPSIGASPQPRRASDGSETDSVIGSGFEEDLVESHPIRFVSPPESADTVDLEEDAADATVPVESRVNEDGDGSVASEKSSGNRGSSSPGSRGGGGKKLKAPLRDVVKAIVMNSRNVEEEEDKETEKMSYVQILMEKGFKFP